MTLADTEASITAKEERINKAKDNLNCFSADSADSNRKNISSWTKSMILETVTEDLILSPPGIPTIGRLLMH